MGCNPPTHPPFNYEFLHFLMIINSPRWLFITYFIPRTVIVDGNNGENWWNNARICPTFYISTIHNKAKGVTSHLYLKTTSKTLHFRNHPFIMLTLFPSLFFSLFSNTFTHKNVPLIQLAEYRFIFTAVASFFNCFRLKKTEGNIAIRIVIQSLNISLIAIEFENVYGCIFRWLYRPTYNKLSYWIEIYLFLL